MTGGIDFGAKNNTGPFVKAVRALFGDDLSSLAYHRVGLIGQRVI